MGFTQEYWLHACNWQLNASKHVDKIKNKPMANNSLRSTGFGHTSHGPVNVKHKLMQRTASARCLVRKTGFTPPHQSACLARADAISKAVTAFKRRWILSSEPLTYSKESYFKTEDECLFVAKGFKQHLTLVAAFCKEASENKEHQRSKLDHDK